jgi:DNA-binding transcriptional ArsR family regulator
MVIQVVEGTVESRILHLLLEMYPVTVRDLERELSLRDDVLERALKRLVARGIVEVEPLSDRTYVRLIRRDFSFSGLKPSQRRRVRHHGGKREKPKDYDGPMFG